MPLTNTGFGFFDKIKLPQMGNQTNSTFYNPDRKKDYRGSNFSYLQDYLKKMLGGGLPNRKQFQQYAAGNIGKQTQQSLTGLNERLAGSGLYRSGVGANAQAQIYGNQANALAGVENDLNQQELAYTSQAIAQLLGLNQFEGNQKLAGDQFDLSWINADRQYDLGRQGIAEQRRQFDEQNDGWFAELLGSLVGAGGQVGAAALSGGSSLAFRGSDRRLKRNIKKVGFENGYNIYEFNYLWDNVEHKGVMSDEVPREAIVIIDGYDFVDYSKIGVSFV